MLHRVQRRKARAGRRQPTRTPVQRAACRCIWSAWYSITSYHLRSCLRVMHAKFCATGVRPLALLIYLLGYRIVSMKPAWDRHQTAITSTLASLGGLGMVSREHNGTSNGRCIGMRSSTRVGHAYHELARLDGYSLLGGRFAGAHASQVSCSL